MWNENLTENDVRILKDIDPDKLPVHIAIIMDGNGRWAKQKGKQRIKGHMAGVDSIRNIITFSGRIGIKYLTLYAFSVENWNRPKAEVNQLMKLLKDYLIKELPNFKKNNVRFNTIGLIDGLPESVQKEIHNCTEQTKNHTGLNLILALNYSGRSEIADAVKRIVHDAKNDIVNVKDIDERFVSGYLFTKNMPDPDLLIRTSGEFRISNFLLWQISYAEIWITPTLWPDFRDVNLVEAIREFQQRERRFGKV